MKRKYEGVFIINLQGQDAGIDEAVGKVTKELERSGAILEQIDRLGRKEFAYPNHAKQSHGYYVQYRFDADPAVIRELETHLRLNEQVMLQHFRRL